MGSLATQEKEGRKQKIFLVLTLFGLLNWTYVKILSYERENMRFLLLFFPFLLYFFVGAFLFAFDNDICLFFSGRHKSYNSKDLKPWVLLQHKKKKEEGNKKYF